MASSAEVLAGILIGIALLFIGIVAYYLIKCTMKITWGNLSYHLPRRIFGLYGAVFLLFSIFGFMWAPTMTGIAWGACLGPLFLFFTSRCLFMCWSGSFASKSKDHEDVTIPSRHFEQKKALNKVIWNFLKEAGYEYCDYYDDIADIYDTVEQMALHSSVEDLKQMRISTEHIEGLMRRLYPLRNNLVFAYIRNVERMESLSGIVPKNIAQMCLDFVFENVPQDSSLRSIRIH